MSKSSILTRVVIFLCFVLPFTATSQTTSPSLGGIPFSYSLSTNAKTSAGVYKPDSTLIRTLWGNQQEAAGAHTASWDGKDDAGTLMPDGNYRIQVLSNNVAYTWEGILGNSSQNFSGSSVYHQYAPGFWDMCIVNGKATGVVEYNEGSAAEFSFNTNNPQVKLPVWANWQHGKTGVISSHMCTDGTNLYFGGVSNGVYNGVQQGNFLNPASCVFAKKVSDYTNTIFSSGVNHQPEHGPTDFTAYPSVIDVKTVTGDSIYRITGMAVQKAGNYLFVARRNLNSVHVVNKTTGALVQALSVNRPMSMAVDNDGNLWMVTDSLLCKKYTVNSNGTLTQILSLSGLVQPLCLQVTPDNTKLYITDGGNSQQVKIYNNATGALISTFGQLGGYATNPDVTNDKFMFGSEKFFDPQPYPERLLYNSTAFICFDANDNSWWMWDLGNERIQHYSSTNTFIESISSVGFSYSSEVDFNNPTRVFSYYLEFQVDYSKPLAPNNSSWKLVKNWSYGRSASTHSLFGVLQGLTTLSNGKTYALNTKGNGLGVVELSSTGLRYTGQEYGSNYVLNKDGSLWIYERNQSALTSTWKRSLLTGFDGNNNPVWATPVTIATITGGDDQKPANEGAGFRPNQITANGLVTYFDTERSGGYHLGAIKPGDNKWLWRASSSTHNQYRGEFPDDGTYDIGNGVINGGSAMQSIEKNVFWGYKGENWKGAQTNKYNQYYDNGLMVGQFGVTEIEAQQLASEAYPMMAGNVLGISVVKVGSDYYLYHNDEVHHGGVHRWKISGLNTIDVQSISIVKAGTPPIPVYDYTDLMAGLPFNDTLTNNTAGWTRFSHESGSFSVKTNYGTYKKSDRDLQIISIGQNIDCWVKRDLGTNSGLVNWKIVGQMSYPQAGENQDNFMEVRDASDKIIVRISRPESYPNLEVKANSSRIAFGQDVYATVGKLLPLSIVAANGTITVNFGNYAPVTVTPFDPAASIGTPRTLQLYTVSNPSGHQINIARLKFYKNFGIVSVSAIHFRSKGSGLWKNTSSWQSSTDSSNWVDATAIPDSSANSITIYNNHIITLTDTAIVDQLTIQNVGGLRVAPNALLSVNDGTGNDITVAGTGTMVIQSDATGTGRIGKSSGTVVGNVTVERYISSNNNKAYRLLGPTVNTASSPKPFIRSNWQEGQNNTSVLSNSNTVSGYGIHITGNMLGNNGFDATLTGISSLMYYNQTATSQDWAAAPNTDATNFDVKKGYLVYIRGDRSTDLHANTTSSNTTLRTTGSIATGTQIFTNQESNGRNSLVTNPYPCPIDWSAIYNDPSASNGANFENYYTYWDPNIGLSGGYVTVNANGTKSAATSATTEIQSGQAFFIKAKQGITSPTFTVKESHKSGSANLNVFRTGSREQFRSALYFTDANGVRKMADAVNAVFDTAFSKAIDGNDAEEMANWDENVGISRAAKMFSIEGRPLIDITDTIQLVVQRLKMQNYEWQFEPMGFALPNLKAYLEDKYLNTRTQMNLTAITVISFSVNAVPGSAAADRFRIVFGLNSSLPVTMRSLKAYQKGTGVQVDWTTSQENNVDHYDIEKSTDGRQFIKAGTVLAATAGNLVNYYNWFDTYPTEGSNYYRIKTIDKNGTVSYSQIVNIKIGGKKGSFEIYPNPVAGRNLIVQFNSIAKGIYTVSLINEIGQKILSKVIDHPGNSASQTISVSENLPAGNYNLQISGNGILYNKKVVK